MDLALAVGICGTAALPPEVSAEVRSLAEALADHPRAAGSHDDSCPADRRVEAFLNAHFADLTRSARLRLPVALALTRHGIARELSLPAGRDTYANEYVTSYRVRNGVLHNPRSDRRTTKGTFHVCEGGLPIPGDKKAVPRPVFVALFRQALSPPAELLVVPLTSTRSESVRAFVSLPAPARSCVRRYPALAPRRAWKSAFSRRGAW